MRPCASGSTSSAPTRAGPEQRPGRLPLGRGVRLRRRRPGPGHRCRAACLPGLAHGVRRGLRRAVRRAGRPRLDGRGGPGPRRAAGGTGGVDADYLGASYGTQLGATYAELFPDRAGRLVLDAGVDLSADHREMALDQARVSRPRCAPTCRTASTAPTAASWGVRGRGWPDPAVPRRGRRASAADGDGPRPRGGQRLLRDRPPALQPGLLDRAQPGPAERVRRRRHDVAAALGRLHRARRTASTPTTGSRRSTTSTASTTRRRSRRRRWTSSSRRSRRRPTFGRSSAWGLTSCLGFEARPPSGWARSGGRRAADRGHRHHA